MVIGLLKATLQLYADRRNAWQSYKECYGDIHFNIFQLNSLDTVTRVIKIYTKYGVATLVIVPFDTRSRADIAGIIYLISSDRVRAYAVELQETKNTIHRKVYYFDSKGNLQVAASTQSFLSCLWACIGWEIPACALTCAACPETVLACLACAACVGKGACCVGKCGKQEWGEPFCATIDILCQLGNSWACAIDLGCEGYC